MPSGLRYLESVRHLEPELLAGALQNTAQGLKLGVVGGLDEVLELEMASKTRGDEGEG